MYVTVQQVKVPSFHDYEAFDVVKQMLSFPNWNESASSSSQLF